MIRAHSCLLDFLDTTYVPLTLISGETRDSYAESIRLFDRFAWFPSWQLITPELVGAFLHDQMLNGRSTDTAAKHYRQLVCVLRKAREQKRIKIKIKQIPRPKINGTLPVAWSVDEFTRVLDEARRLPGEAGIYPLADTISAVLLLCWCTDWRISAVMSIETKRIDLAAGHVVSIEKKTRQERFAELVPESLPVIERIMDRSRPLLFGFWPYDRGCNPKRNRRWKRLANTLGKCVQLAGVRDIGRFHSIRKTATTAIAASEGVDAAARFAGHSNYRVTVKHYIDPTQMPRVGSKLPRLNLGG